MTEEFREDYRKKLLTAIEEYGEAYEEYQDWQMFGLYQEYDEVQRHMKEAKEKIISIFEEILNYEDQ